MRRVMVCALVLVASACAGPAVPPPLTAVSAALPEAPACSIFPPDSYWRAEVSALPEHPSSAAWVEAIGADRSLFPDFGSGQYEGSPIGIPYDVVGADIAHVPVEFEFADESDPGPYPLPDQPTIEGGPDGDGDRHVLLLDAPDCVLYELYLVTGDARTGWQAGSGAVFDLASNDLRPDTWTSADAAGLPILPGLVRYDEVAAGVIDHAIRITAPRTDRSYLWPARHQAGADDDPALPPMGAWFRLDPAIDPADFPPQAQPIVVALQTHGAILADNGSAWFASGVPDERWDNDQLRALREIPGSSFTAVDVSSLRVDPDSGAILGGGGDLDLREGGRLAGPGRIETAIAIAAAQFPDGADTVYLARADTVVDAVAGGVLTSGPILLVPSCGSLPATVAAEIARLDPRRVVALGGPNAVCDALLTEARTR